jgi:hypothetical protein
MTTARKAKPKSPAKAHPTTVRLSPDIRRRLAEEAQRRKRSQTFIVEEAIQRYLDGWPAPDVQIGSLPDLAERRRLLEPYIGLGERLGVGRTAEEIDASIREIRGER